jgi:hypothetical protein
VVASIAALEEQLHVWELELTQRDEVLIVWEEKAQISKITLVKVSANFDAEWAKTEATRQDASTQHPRQAHPRPRQDAVGEEGLA